MDRSSEERRLAALLIVDIVGYSRLLCADESGTLRRLKALRHNLIDPAIVSAHGRIVNASGDGLLAEFPSPLRAVICAVEIQYAMRTCDAEQPPDLRFRLRFGIDVGDVVVEPNGDLYGEGVNVAARLEKLADPGGVHISRSVHDQVQDKLSYNFKYLGKRELKNIARPVDIFGLSAAAIADLPEGMHEHLEQSKGLSANSRSSTRLAVFRRGGLALLACSAAAMIAVVGGRLLWSAITPSQPGNFVASPGHPAPKPMTGLSLVVLPFANLSNDPEQDFFADGLTEDLTTDLSRLAGSFVIAHNTAFTYKGKAVDVKQIGRDLGVRYALEGSVRRTGDDVVLNAQLISTETGVFLWADRFTGQRSRLGELQVEFVALLARSLDVQLTQAESLYAVRERPNDPTASDLAMRGWAAFNRPRTKENVAEAASLFEKALSVEPDLVQALAGLSRTKSVNALSRWSSSRVADIEAADTLITKALAIDSESAHSRYAKGDVHRARGEFDQASSMYKSAIESNRNFATAYAVAGHTKTLSGRAEEARPLISIAMRLSPRDPQLNLWKYWMCHSYTHQALWKEAIEWCNDSVSNGPFWQTFIDLAAGYAWMDDPVAAHSAVDRILELKPGYTVQKWANEGWSTNATFLTEYARIVEGLRKAGLPEN